MQLIHSLSSVLLNPTQLIQTIGLIGLLIIVFAESGLFFGFFLPGDSLLFTAGFLASQGYVNIGLLMLGSFVAAVLGDSVGYAFGKKIGPTLFSRDHSFFFNKKYIERSQQFYVAHGARTLILARFMPIVRTFAPIVAGVGQMEYKKFLTFNIIGGLVWSVGISGLGYFLGRSIPNVDKYLLPIIVAILVISFIPSLIHLFAGAKTDTTNNLLEK